MASLACRRPLPPACAALSSASGRGRRCWRSPDIFSSVNDMVDAPSPPAEGTLALAAELLTAISAIRRIARRAARLAWQDEPLPPAQSELLRLAAARPGLSVADAAHELRLA